VDEITRIRSFRADVSEPSAQVVAAARGALFVAVDSRPAWRRWAVRSRRTLVVALALACLLGGAGALAAAGVLGDGILSGPSAPPENDVALQALFPPYRIGHATELAESQGRKLFGARTASGGYCFSATSPIDPKGEGGHCVSKAEANTLEAGGTVAFAMSGWSVGGYAPGASSVRVAGAGIDVTFPVGENGWWLGVAELPKNPLPNGQDRAQVVATGIGPDGRVLGEDPLMLVTIARTVAGRVIGIGIAFN
jgi:hypothetical protein